MFFLGIDGGGTKTKAILMDETDKVYFEKLYRSCNYIVDGESVIYEVLGDILEDVKDYPIQSVFFAIAGYKDIPSDVPIIERKVADNFPNYNIVLGNDTENALAGALAGEPGINVIAGTGSIGLGLSSKKEYIRSGGWHHVFGGDEGSAYWIASQLLINFTRQSDGRDPKTKLYAYMKEKYNLINDEDILELVITEWDASRSKIASLAIDVYNLAVLGDTIALDIYKRAAKELADIVLAIANKIDERPLKVSYTGGVFKAGSYILDPLNEYIGNNELELVAPIYSPDIGSVILAKNNI